jgi:hypothetical protein
VSRRDQCRARSDPKAPFPFTNRDDCLISGGDGTSPPNQLGVARLWLPHPFLSGQRQAQGSYTLSARRGCMDNGGESEYKCTSSRRHGFILGAGPQQPHLGMAAIAPAQTHVSLGRNSWVPLVRFEATGKCTWLPSNLDCSFLAPPRPAEERGPDRYSNL